MNNLWFKKLNEVMNKMFKYRHPATNKWHGIKIKDD